jgi:hypothetical protein
MDRPRVERPGLGEEPVDPPGGEALEVVAAGRCGVGTACRSAFVAATWSGLTTPVTIA